MAIIPAQEHGMRFSRLLAVCLMLACAFPTGSRAAESVDVALVLVSDVSRSIDDSEYMLEKQGYAFAFADPQVIAAIRGGTTGVIAVAYVEFAGSLEVKTVLDWSVIRDATGAKEFGDRLLASQRSFYGRTAISAGIDHAVQMLAENEFDAGRRVIDVCGDGTNNAGREIGTARDGALHSHITINGLAIINDHPVSWTFAHVQPPGGLAKYYRDNVTGGPGSFVLEIHDFHTFGEAMTRKLVSEIAVLPAPGHASAMPVFFRPAPVVPPTTNH
jgi:hypothetical protein